MPSVPPIRSARSVRGRRISRTMMLALPKSETSALAAVQGAICAGPMARDASASTTVTNVRRPTSQPPRSSAPLTAIPSPCRAHAAVERAPGGTVVEHLFVALVGQVFSPGEQAERVVDLVVRIHVEPGVGRQIADLVRKIPPLADEHDARLDREP